MSKWLACGIALFCSPDVIGETLLIINWTEHGLVIDSTVKNCYICGVTVLVIAIYSNTVISLLSAMRKWHRLEYKVHRNKILVLFFGTLVSLLIALGQNINSVQYFMCIEGYMLGETDAAKTLAMMDFTAPTVGICKHLTGVTADFYFSAKFFTAVLFYNNFAI